MHEVPVDSKRIDRTTRITSLGVYEIAADEPAAGVVTSRDTDGYVIIDAVQWACR
jgi:hypothetical protein